MSRHETHSTDVPAEAASLRKLEQQLRQNTTPLPGSEPYFNRRPLNIPARYDGWTLINTLADWHPQVGRSSWQQKIADGSIVMQRPTGAAASAVSPQQIVRGGEQWVHLLPATVEPDVSNAVRFLHEDEDLLVVHKPAPLPLHPSGRFHRNTLQYFLQQMDFPMCPRIVHRLDANTSGVLVLCRHRAAAQVIQPQFESRMVQKIYLARVQGHPSQDRFVCDAPVSPGPGALGVREVDRQAGLAADTRFEVLTRDSDGTSLLRVTPVTGRTNQIRLHLWYLGFPIVNDPAWTGPGCVQENRTLQPGDPVMCLHAWQISVRDTAGQLQTFTAPTPGWASGVEAV